MHFTATAGAELRVVATYDADRGSKERGLANNGSFAASDNGIDGPIPMVLRALQKGSSARIGTIEARAVSEGSVWNVEICVDPENAPPGTYTGVARFIGEASGESIPITVTLKSRPAHILGAALLLLAAGYRSWIAAFIASEAPDDRGRILAVVAATGAAVSLYTAVILRDATFGHDGPGFWAFCLFFGATLTAATGAATLALGGLKKLAK